jgi:hypothetical protein
MKVKTINLQWIVSTLLVVWFLFVHSPPVLLERGVSALLRRPAFLLHLAGSYAVYLACIHNTARDPFRHRASHAWVGRIGLAAGAVGFAFGVAAIVARWEELDKGFALGITFGGLMQVRLQYRGYMAIREYRRIKDELQSNATRIDALSTNATMSADQDNGATSPQTATATQASSPASKLTLRERQQEHLRTHVSCMIGLFVNACGTPAAMRAADRLAGALSPRAAAASPILLVTALFLLYALQKSYKRAALLYLQKKL